MQNLIIDSVKDHLVVPLPPAQAIYRALAAVGVYQELVVESGWTIDQYEHWVVTQLAGQLLGTPADQLLHEQGPGGKAPQRR